MEQSITLENLIPAILFAMLSSSVLAALGTSWLNRRKIVAEAFEATGRGAKHLVAGSIDLVEEYRKAFEENVERIGELETEVGYLNKRLDRKTEEWLRALAFKQVLEEKAVEQGKQIRRLEMQVHDLQKELLGMKG